MDLASYGQWAVDLVNTWDPVMRPADPEGERQAVRHFLATHHPGLAERATEVDVEALELFREELRPVFEADTDEQAIEALNELLARTPVQPAIVTHDGEPWHWHLSPQDVSVADTIRTAATVGLAALLLQHGVDRRGVCRHERCIDVFVDTSPNRTRRYCSDGCSNRANVAAHRARKRAERDAGSGAATG